MSKGKVFFLIVLSLFILLGVLKLINSNSRNNISGNTSPNDIEMRRLWDLKEEKEGLRYSSLNSNDPEVVKKGLDASYKADIQTFVTLFSEYEKNYGKLELSKDMEPKLIRDTPLVRNVYAKIGGFDEDGFNRMLKRELYISVKDYQVLFCAELLNDKDSTITLYDSNFCHGIKGCYCRNYTPRFPPSG